MNNLLNNDFVVHARYSVGSVVCQTASFVGPFTLKDDTACANCQQQHAYFYNTCNYENMCINANNAATLINHEAFMVALKQEKGGVADFLLYTQNSVAFIDLTCGFSQYIESHEVDGVRKQGKRVKAREQLDASINRLYEVPAIGQQLDAYQIKVGILGYRNIDEEMFVNVKSNLDKSEDAFMSMTKELETRPLKMSLSHGFAFQMVKYPQVYTID